MLDLRVYRTKTDRLLADWRHARRTAKEETVRLSEAKQRVEVAEQCQEILQAVAKQVQQQAHDQVASVVTSCLQAVFGPEYGFGIDFQEKRGRTEATLTFFKDGHEVDPTDASGGGVLDVAAMALRLSCLLLSIPRRRRLLVLDEPFRMLSDNHVPHVRDMLLRLTKELNLQIIMITHDPDLACGKIIHCEKVADFT